MTEPRFEFDDQDPRRRLDATDKDPRISVSTIGEYTFCTRAGVLSHESRAPDRGEEELSLDLLPRYERETIIAAVNRETKLWGGSLALFLATSFVSVWLMPQHGSSRTVVLALASAFLLAMVFLIVSKTRNMVALLRRYHDAHSGVARDFDYEDDEIHPVVWWDFYESGFESQDPKPMLDENWNLDGKPWRIVTKGSQQIPVFRTRTAHEHPKPQHIAKVMAYCHLILATQSRVSPFAVILYGNSYEGVAIPNEDRHRRPFHTALSAARKTIRKSQDGIPPEPPTHKAKCSQCPWGRPRPLSNLQPTMRDGQELDPIILTSNRGTHYHSTCCDRFDWLPPHDRSKELNLRMQKT